MARCNSSIELIDYQIRELELYISKEDEYSEENALGVDFEFMQHESDPDLYLVNLILTINGDVPKETEVLLRLRADLEGYVRVPSGCGTVYLRAYLVAGTELVYNTFRGTLACLLGQTAAKDYILPAVDFNRIAGIAPNY